MLSILYSKYPYIDCWLWRTLRWVIWRWRCEAAGFRTYSPYYYTAFWRNANSFLHYEAFNRLMFTGFISKLHNHLTTCRLYSTADGELNDALLTVFIARFMDQQQQNICDKAYIFDTQFYTKLSSGGFTSVKVTSDVKLTWFYLVVEMGFGWFFTGVI